MVVQDASNQNRLPTILDNMIADHRLPVMIAVMFIATAAATGRAASAASNTTPSPANTPSSSKPKSCRKIAKDYHVTFTKDPDGRATMGGSSGGGVRVHDGVVSSRAVSPRADLLRHVREPAIAGESASRRTARGNITSI